MSDAVSNIPSHAERDAAYVAEAYDELAAGYDASMEHDDWVRDRLREHYLRCFPAGARLLDVGCGTGMDAVFLASRGFEVAGCDISAEMLRHVQIKADRSGLSDRIETRQVNLAQGLPWPDASFDGMLSAFGALNTVDELSTFSAEAARVLRPDGCMLLHMVNRFNIWEWMHCIRQGRWRTAARLRRQEVRPFGVGDQSIVHFLPTSGQAYRKFERHFTRRGRFALGVFAPPPDKQWLPASAAAGLRWMETHLGDRRPFVDWGRFYLLELTRRRA